MTLNVIKRATPRLASFESLARVLSPAEHFKRASDVLQVASPNKEIKNVKQRIKQHAIVSIDALCKSLTSPISSIINFHKQSYQGMHPFEKTILALTNIARIKSKKLSSDMLI